jgi:hypothetical protein
MHVLACCLQLASPQQEQMRFDVLAALGKGEPSMILPCGLLPWSGHSSNSINCQRNEQKARSIAGETHNCKPFPMLVHETRKESLYMP